MRLGLMQGRLAVPAKGHIQEFPDNWEDEFAVLRECGLVGVEWLITCGSRDTNPLLTDPETVNHHPVLSVCVDTLVHEKIIDATYLSHNLEDLCDSLMAFTDIRNVTIPLLEASSMVEETIRSQFCQLMKPIGEKYPEIRFSFEAELGIMPLQEILSLCDNFYVTYDTGNITSYGLDHAEYVRALFPKINNVHLKDRTFDARTVAPLHGDTNFEEIFKLLKEVGYNGAYILQTARGPTGHEKQTILNHIEIFRELYERSV